jgi:hypothetical protein
MPIFISYRHTDRIAASNINDRLKAEGIKTYLDVLDPESQSSDDIAALITRRIPECSHLLAVVSEETAKSWWVPFEIGEATIISRRICSYQIGYTTLPQYLSKWPILKNNRELDMFSQEYKQELKALGGISLEHLVESSVTGRNQADIFHSQLKNRILRGI